MGGRRERKEEEGLATDETVEGKMDEGKEGVQLIERPRSVL